MKKQLTWKEAIEKVLASSPSPLHYSDIANKIISDGYRSDIGATPSLTVSSLITTSIKKQKDESPFMRVGKGIYSLKKQSLTEPVIHKKLTPEVVSSEEEEEQYEIITSFGMFWRKENVEWLPKPKLLGMQNIGAIPVDFYSQLGIYLLYDGREVIYVGRTTERSLGKRLYEHTIDRLSARWDRFSWFGLLPVKNDGTLGQLPSSYVAAKLIPALESILIEALEPRQNRKRGDDLEAVEFIQQIDPKIEKKKAKAIIEDALNKS